MFDYQEKRKLRILLDSKSLESDSAKRLLQYHDNKLFEFISLGESKKHTIARLHFDKGKNVDLITIDKFDGSSNEYSSRALLANSTENIRVFSKYLNIKYDDLLLVFILKTFTDNHNHKREKTILITERKDLLNRLNWTKDHFPKIPNHSILHPDEACIFIDLHCKKQNTFQRAPSYHTNKGGWYLYSFKTKLTEYQNAWSVVTGGARVIPEGKNLQESMSSLEDRITDMLIAIDEIGMNYYTSVDNDTRDSIIYHFNYWSILFMGVFDTLAWMSAYRYRIAQGNPTTIGLKGKKEFLQCLYEKNPQIQDYLKNNSAIIDLMREHRNSIVHRNLNRDAGFENTGQNQTINILQISREFFYQIVQFSGEKGDEMEEWGHYKFCEDCPIWIIDLSHKEGGYYENYSKYSLEPYRFVKKATNELIAFANEYLKLLDFEEYCRNHVTLKQEIKDSRQSKNHQHSLRQLDAFDKFRLGY